MTAQTRIILIVSAVVALVFFAAGILIGHFAIKKCDKSDDDSDSSDSLSVECDGDQYTEEGEAYKDR